MPDGVLATFANDATNNCASERVHSLHLVNNETALVRLRCICCIRFCQVLVLVVLKNSMGSNRLLTSSAVVNGFSLNFNLLSLGARQLMVHHQRRG